MRIPRHQLQRLPRIYLRLCLLTRFLLLEYQLLLLQFRTHFLHSQLHLFLLNLVTHAVQFALQCGVFCQNFNVYCKGFVPFGSNFLLTRMLPGLLSISTALQPYQILGPLAITSFARIICILALPVKMRPDLLVPLHPILATAHRTRPHFTSCDMRGAILVGKNLGASVAGEHQFLKK